jgi:hypothetical protein
VDRILLKRTDLVSAPELDLISDPEPDLVSDPELDPHSDWTETEPTDQILSIG